MSEVSSKPWFNAKLSKKFYLVCKKCEEDSDDDIIAKLEKIVSKCDNKWDDININYTPKTSQQFALKFIFKYNKPNVLKYIMDYFINHSYESINWFMIDNPNLYNNVLHYLIADLSTNKDIENAVEIFNLLFYSTSKYKDKLIPCFELLYQINDYNYTPSMYAEQRKLHKLGVILENVQFRHIYQIICVECKIPDVIALLIIQYGFQLYHINDILQEIKAVNININNKPKQKETNININKKIKKYKVGEIYFRYEEIKYHFKEMYDPTQKEMYLQDIEFEQIFGMTKSDFNNNISFWKQKQLKREYGLF